MSELLETRDGKIVTLTLNREDSRNALSLSLVKALHQAIERVGSDPECYVAIIAANGPVFSAGHDLKEITKAREADDNGRGFFEEIMSACSAMMQAIVKCPKPVIAQVQGTATAAGCQLVATADLAVAADSAKFATPGVNIGLFCSTPMVALSRNVSRKHAMEMLLTGELIDAAKAQELGLLNRVVPVDALRKEALSLANQIASKSPKTLRIGKEAFYAQAELPLTEAYDYAGRVMVANLLERDSEEGIGAFVEKRTPSWEPLS